MRFGYLGPAGSHSHAATQTFAKTWFSPQTGPNNGIVQTLVPLSSFTALLDAVEEGALDAACLPVENALEGSVNEILDTLALASRDNTCIRAEFIWPIRHALIRKYPVMEGIRFIHSHPQAIGQCRDAIYALLGKEVGFIPAASTSQAVQALITLDETHAALGSAEAASLYDMDILIPNLGDFSHNVTRFLVIAPIENNSVGHDIAWPQFKGQLKTTLCVGLYRNHPGSLLALMTILAHNQLNMSKIESRPTRKVLGEYFFYLDVEGSLDQAVLSQIEALCNPCKRLGTYSSLGILASS